MSWGILIASITVHLILIYSIFDVYYTSPLVHGIPPQSINSQDFPAKRVFVISADGLRYDTFNKYPEMSPYLHSIMNNRKGIYGLSRSHVPTESRPGHVAIFAGITEDISAVAKGWKKNPVQFDAFSIYHQIVGCGAVQTLLTYLMTFPMQFHIHTQLMKKTSLRQMLPIWTSGFLTNSRTSKVQPEFRLNAYLFVSVVDEGVEKVQKIVDDFFQDQNTAWLFTSDHGMTDWGSHGAGSDDEVLTPFVAWGAGIKKGGQKLDIQQIDLAPLISSLIGCPIPVNSMGILPVQMMDSRSSSYQFKAIEANFRQLKEQIIFLRNAKSNRLWFHQFDKFGDKAMESLQNTLISLGRDRRFSAATSLFADNAYLMKEAIVFYHRYDRQMLGAAVSCSFIAWIALVISFLNSSSQRISYTLLVPHRVFVTPFLCSIAFSIYCSLSFSQTVYIILPIYLISILENHSGLMKYARERSVTFFAQPDWLNKLVSKELFAKPFLTCIGFSEFLAKSFFQTISTISVITVGIFVLTFVDRAFLAAVFVLLMFLPQFYSDAIVSYWSKTWMLTCLILCIFPFLPAVGVSTQLPLCILSPLITAAICHRLSRRPCLARLQELLKIMVYVHSTVAVFLAVVNYGFDKPPSIARWVSWVSIPLSLVAPSLLSGPYILDRLVAYSLCFYVPYTLLSISYESMFVIVFLFLLAMFVRFEFGHLSDVELFQLKIDSTKVATGGYVEVRRTVVCVSFVLCTLFGTGNFASINSFNPSTLNLFISVFSPFIMAILLILKLLIPILLVSSAFASIIRFDPESIQRLCCFSLIFTDFMSMCFFHQLKDDGSWLDIGMSISQFIVSMCISLALLVLLSISSHLMAFDLLRKAATPRLSQEIESVNRSLLSDDEAA
ncbi:Protein CBG04200 [Caenorhabditis briggsae]|uniref:GPI ethanolamine phosphate transferase 1 n=1 Tax=Caenorhabditis briggsae TaxID=6238 RepID=A8WWE7_CAEBR|nr:Protein CBG04200 [Caenorhabditis briggsae]CAP24956.2 Protein CBG04200 [Caenorhabditis briggsae]